MSDVKEMENDMNNGTQDAQLQDDQETAIEDSLPKGEQEAESDENTDDEKEENEKHRNLFSRLITPTHKGRGYGFTVYSLLTIYFLWGVICLLKYGYEREDYSWLKWCAIPAGVLTLLAGIQTFRVIRASKKNKEKNFGQPVNRFVLALIFSFNSMLMPDLIMGSPPVKRNIIYTLLGLSLCMCLYLMGAAMFKNPKVWFGIINGFFAFYGFMQYYIFLFRGAPIQFSDLFNIESAKEASDLYQFSFALMPVYAIINVALMIIIFIKVKLTPVTAKQRVISAAGSVLCALALVFVGKIGYDIGIKNRYIIMNFSGNENKLTYSNVVCSILTECTTTSMNRRITQRIKHSKYWDSTKSKRLKRAKSP